MLWWEAREGNRSEGKKVQREEVLVHQQGLRGLGCLATPQRFANSHTRAGCVTWGSFPATPGLPSPTPDSTCAGQRPRAPPCKTAWICRDRVSLHQPQGCRGGVCVPVWRGADELRRGRREARGSDPAVGSPSSQAGRETGGGPTTPHEHVPKHDSKTRRRSCRR